MKSIYEGGGDRRGDTLWMLLLQNIRASVHFPLENKHGMYHMKFVCTSHRDLFYSPANNVSGPLVVRA